MSRQRPSSRVGKLFVLMWLVLFVPAYLHAYGAAHFIQLCDLSVLLACLGYLADNRLLLSAQALGAPAIGLLWLADLLARAFNGHGVTGAADYLWDPSIPLLARLLSTFHLGLPILLLVALRRGGYDRRALALQTLIAGAAIAMSATLLPADSNINYVRHWPNGGHFPGPPAIHAIASWFLLCACIYAPTHLLCQQVFRGAHDSRRA